MATLTRTMNEVTMRSPITYIDMNMTGHATRSGYTQIALESGKQGRNRVITPNRNPGRLVRWLASVAARLAQSSGVQWYNRWSLIAELSSLGEVISQRRTIVHYLYGENCFRYGGIARRSWLGRNCRLVATFHTPAERFKELISYSSHIKSLDAVVIMSESQRPIFSELLDNSKIHFIPHGVDTTYFTPPTDNETAVNRKTQSNHRVRFITVGNHLRDYDALAEVACSAEKDNLNAEFVVIANPKQVTHLKEQCNITCLHGLTDDHLLKQYQEADVLLLPLKDATANNSLLEGMACGLPVVITDLPGARDYAPKGQALYTNSNDEMLQYLREICAGKHNLALMGASSRARAEELSWSNVRAQLAHLYEQL